MALKGSLNGFYLFSSHILNFQPLFLRLKISKSLVLVSFIPGRNSPWGNSFRVTQSNKK